LIGYFPTNSPYGPWRGENPTTPYTGDDGFDFYCYSEPDCHWINFKREGTDGSDGIIDHWKQNVDEDNNHQQIQYINEKTLTPGKGYLAAIGKESMLMTDGVLNNGSISCNVSYTTTLTGAEESYRGINLIGNPYQSYLKADDFLDANGDNLADKAYYIIDADKSGYITYTHGSSSNDEYAPPFIHPHQGFIVMVKSGVTSLNFTNSMRSSGKSTSTFREERPNYPLINLICYDGNGKRDLTTVEIDRPEPGGARKMKSLPFAKAMIYTHYENRDYQVLFAPEGVNEVPVRFEVFEDDVFTLSWSMHNGDFHYAHLIDNITGADIDLLSTNEYKFQGSHEDYHSRFKLIFGVTGIEEYEDNSTTGSGPFAFQFGNELIVNGDGIIQLFSINGRCLLSTNIEGGQSSVALPNIASGLYLLRLTNSKQTQVQKIIIK